MLNHQEPSDNGLGDVWYLQYPPLYILLRVDDMDVLHLSGLPDKVIPVEPAKAYFKCTFLCDNKRTTINVLVFITILI